jgi:hypothetical protein
VGLAYTDRSYLLIYVCFRYSCLADDWKHFPGAVYLHLGLLLRYSVGTVFGVVVSRLECLSLECECGIDSLCNMFGVVSRS